MKTAIGAFLGCIALIVLWSAPARSQAEGREYTGAWNHEHRHTCIEASEYPWSRALAEKHHEIGVASTRPCPDCLPVACLDCSRGHCTMHAHCAMHAGCTKHGCGSGAPPAGAYTPAGGCAPQEGCCPNGHVLPRALYQQNVKMIRGLRCAYCIPEQYADELLARCEQAHRECGMHPAGRCFVCAPAPGCRGAGTLETIHEELMLLKHKCVPCDER
jgi:hypothetical protein